MIDLLTELGGRVARALDDENEDGSYDRQAAIRARGTWAAIVSTQGHPTIHVGGGSAPTRKSKRSAR